MGILGVMHTTSIRVCRCTTLSLLLISLGFWPSRPVNPQLAFDLGFLNLMRILLLESQTSTKSYVESHRIMNKLSVLQVRTRYYRLDKTLTNQQSYVEMNGLLCGSDLQN